MAKKNKGRKVQPNQRIWLGPHKKKKGESVASEMSRKDYEARYLSEHGFLPPVAWYEKDEEEPGV